MSRRLPPPPSANPQGVPDDRNTRHSCGFAYNAYKWGSCPKCKADDTGCFALGCCSCRNTWFHAEREAMCPSCGSGETTVIVSPETPRVR